jgi:hypothetical protein
MDRTNRRAMAADLFRFAAGRLREPIERLLVLARSVRVVEELHARIDELQRQQLHLTQEVDAHRRGLQAAAELLVAWPSGMSGKEFMAELGERSDEAQRVLAGLGLAPMRDGLPRWPR